jgi:iron complex outermembrane receptor protein
MIPFAALERVEVLRDGASSLYGSDAVGGVINFITKKDYQGGTVTVGADNPQHDGGFANNANIGYGFGDLEKDGFNIFAMVDHQSQHRIGGTQRDFNTRYAGGLSGSTFPANWAQTYRATLPVLAAPPAAT